LCVMEINNHVCVTSDGNSKILFNGEIICKTWTR